MGFKKNNSDEKTINGVALDVVFNYEKVTKEDGMSFHVDDVYFGTSKENGKFCMLINSKLRQRMFAPPVEVEGLKDAYDCGDMPEEFDVEVIEKTNQKGNRTYFILNY